MIQYSVLWIRPGACKALCCLWRGFRASLQPGKVLQRLRLHLTFVPLTKDNRLCAKEILGGRADLSRWQDDFYSHMIQAYPDLERVESARETGRKHISTRIFKQAVRIFRSTGHSPISSRDSQKASAICGR